MSIIDHNQPMTLTHDNLIKIIINALQDGCVEVASSLINDTNLDVNKATENGDRLLNIVLHTFKNNNDCNSFHMQRNLIDAVAMLGYHRVNPLLVDSNSKSALDIALEYNMLKILQLLHEISSCSWLPANESKQYIKGYKQCLIDFIR